VAINMPVSSLVLYRSRLLPSGSEYEPVWEVALI
jgi:2'-5' RNA ligase